MNICMIISTPFPPEEGIGYYTYNLSKILIEKGHDITVLTRGPWKKIQKINFDGINVIRVPFIPIYPFYLYLHGVTINKIFKSIEQDIDIVHFHSPLPPFVKTTLPIVTTIHTPMLTDYRLAKLQSLYNFLSKLSALFVSYPNEQKLIKNSDIVTTLTDTIADELKQYYSINKNIFVIGNGIDEKLCLSNQNEKKHIKKYILYAGRIDREKGIYDLVKCGQHICKRRTDVYFIIAGKGRDLKKLIKKVENVRLQDKFIFLGQVDKNTILKLYKDATIFVLPSYHEGLPTVLLEAMSCGLPVIATDVRGNRDLIINGKNGIIVPSKNPIKLAEAIEKLVDDNNIRNNLIKNARKTVKEKYTWNIISTKFLRCYESLVGV